MADDNLSAEQNEKLAYFQEITHIDSTDECKQILEAFGWNIEAAVQNTFNEPITPTESIDANLLAQTNRLSSSNSSSMSSLASSINSFTNNNNNNTTSSNRPGTSASLNELNNNSFEFNRPTNPISSSANASLARNQTLPSINLFTQRTLSYHAPQQAVVPRGLFQWGIFIVAFPFKLIFSTLLDFASFFWSFFESNSMPIDYDPLANIAEFAIQYNQKYGTNHADFYQGSYAQAVNEAKRDLKFLVVYLHQNDNKDCHSFASETMTNQDLVEYLNNTVLFWSCSKNLPEGHKVYTALKAKRCPFIGVIVCKNSRMTLVSRIEGPIPAGELMLQLSNLYNEHEHDLVSARHDREVRSQNQLIRQQQDEAYLESLQKDREKQRKKQEEERLKREAEELELKRKEEELQRERDTANRRVTLRKQLEEQPQPDASNPLAIKLLIKLPSGRRYERIFLKTDPLSELYKFVFSNEECPKNFEIETNFPRKVVPCTEETQMSIQEFGINQSMILFVNDLDA